jgi:integrase
MSKIQKVALAKPSKRPYQLRYTCPDTKRRIRISTGTHDEAEALEHKRNLEAKLQLGLDARPKKRVAAGANMAWSDFRERYTDLQLSSLRRRTAADSESRLDIAERIIKPKRLGDMADSEALHELQAKLLAGVESRYDRPRSAHTVKSHMATVMAALNWAEYMGWLPAVPKLRKVKTSKLRHMKGRPITTEEFERMLEATPKVVGTEAAASWQHTLLGLWESGLRLGELLSVSWDDPAVIMPRWGEAYPVLSLPADMQKNDTEESIPLLPGFESVLLETPEHDRSGWIFAPESLQASYGRPATATRLETKWVGKIITRIGKRAGVVVQPPKNGKPPKYASAHDLRRSCADRLIASGVPEREVQRVMRHASGETTRRYYAPGTVQRSAAIIRTAVADSVPTKSGYTFAT